MRGARPIEPTGARRRTEAGFTLLELMFVTLLVGVLAALAFPSFQQMTAKRQATAAAQSLASALRKAQAEATRLNRNVEVLMTTADPRAASAASAAPATPTASTAWMIRVQGATDADGFLGGESRSRFGPSVTTGGNLRAVAFTPMGRVLDVGTGAPVLLSAPRIVQFDVAAQSVRFCTYVTPGGSIRVCDSDASAGNHAACQPRLPSGC